MAERKLLNPGTPSHCFIPKQFRPVRNVPERFVSVAVVRDPPVSVEAVVEAANALPPPAQGQGQAASNAEADRVSPPAQPRN